MLFFLPLLSSGAMDNQCAQDTVRGLQKLQILVEGAKKLDSTHTTRRPSRKAKAAATADGVKQE